MKNRLSLVGLILLIISCNPTHGDNRVSEDITDRSEIDTESSVVYEPSGAESFMFSTNFSLTELKGVKYVSFDFEEGDHAIPGIYHRNSWDVNISQ